MIFLISIFLNTYNFFLSGLAMSIASAAVQICKAARDLAYSSSTKRHRDRISLCVESVTRSAGQLRDFLLSYQYQANGDSHPGHHRHSPDNSGSSSSETKSRDKKGKHSTTPNKETNPSSKRQDSSNHNRKSCHRDDSPDDHADDSGICEEKTSRDSKSSHQSSSSRPSSEVIDKMFSCEGEKAFIGECKSSEKPGHLSSNASLPSSESQSGDPDRISFQRLSLGLTTESSLPLGQMSESELSLKSNDI